MVNSAVQLTFPCPACGGFVTMRTFRASGPCPACGTKLEVNLTVQPVVENEDEGPSSGSGKKFHERRFRPVTQPPPAE